MKNKIKYQTNLKFVEEYQTKLIREKNILKYQTYLKLVLKYQTNLKNKSKYQTNEILNPKVIVFCHIRPNWNYLFQFGLIFDIRPN